MKIICSCEEGYRKKASFLTRVNRGRATWGSPKENDTMASLLIAVMT